MNLKYYAGKHKGHKMPVPRLRGRKRGCIKQLNLKNMQNTYCGHNYKACAEAKSRGENPQSRNLKICIIHITGTNKASAEADVN